MLRADSLEAAASRTYYAWFYVAEALLLSQQESIIDGGDAAGETGRPNGPVPDVVGMELTAACEKLSARKYVGYVNRAITPPAQDRVSSSSRDLPLDAKVTSEGRWISRRPSRTPRTSCSGCHAAAVLHVWTATG